MNSQATILPLPATQIFQNRTGDVEGALYDLGTGRPGDDRSTSDDVLDEGEPGAWG